MNTNCSCDGRKTRTQRKRQASAKGAKGWKSIKVSPEVFSKLEETAASWGKSIDEYVDGDLRKVLSL